MLQEVEQFIVTRTTVSQDKLPVCIACMAFFILLKKKTQLVAFPSFILRGCCRVIAAH